MLLNYILLVKIAGTGDPQPVSDEEELDIPSGAFPLLTLHEQSRRYTALSERREPKQKSHNKN